MTAPPNPPELGPAFALQSRPRRRFNWDRLMSVLVFLGFAALLTWVLLAVFDRIAGLA